VLSKATVTFFNKFGGLAWRRQALLQHAAAGLVKNAYAMHVSVHITGDLKQLEGAT
jgi:hypothetical protein